MSSELAFPGLLQRLRPFKTSVGFLSRPLVTVRKDGIGLNMAFVREARLEKYKYVSLETDLANPQIRMTFHNSTEGNKWYSLGRKKDRRGRDKDLIIQTRRLFEKATWLREVLAKPPSERCFRPGPDGASWVICLPDAPLNIPQWRPLSRGLGYQKNCGELITITPKEISFNSTFILRNGLKDHRRVQFMPDDVNKTLWIRFFRAEEQPEDVWTVLGKTQWDTAWRYVEARAIVNRVPWLKAISTMERSARKFQPQRRGEWWGISIPPAFETKLARENGGRIPKTAGGIYRYLRDGEVVYIGSGLILDRLGYPGREKWIFDTVEYSVIECRDLQFDWECFWIKKHRRETGELPEYNKIEGVKRGILAPELIGD